MGNKIIVYNNGELELKISVESDKERLEYLFKLYEEMIAKENISK